MKHALILSDPPHTDTLDYDVVAPLFSLAPADIRMRVAYPAAEPWFVETDKAELDAKLASLRSAGFTVRVVSLEQFAGLPEAVEIRELYFEAPGLTLKGADTEFTLPYSAPIVVVFAKPVLFGGAREKLAEERDKSRKRKALSSKQDSVEDILGSFGVVGSVAGALAANAMEDPALHPKLADPTFANAAMKEEFGDAFIDVYAVRGKEFSRFRIPITKFRVKCLAEAAGRTLMQNIELVLSRFEEFFSHCEVDRRLVGASCRAPVVQMKPFSKIAAEFDQRLAGASPVELASRACGMASLRRLAAR